MIGVLIFGLTCLILVQAVTIDLPEKSEAKVKRYLTHEHHPPCPLPHLHMPMQSIYLKQPYHVPEYTKQVYKLPLVHHEPIVHQPIVHQPIVHQPIVHQPIVHQSLPWMMEQSIWNSPKINYHASPSYAPNYHTIMPPQSTWPETSKINYHVTSANLFKNPGIVYKKEKNCPPCHHDHQHYQHIQLPVKSIIHQSHGHSSGFYHSPSIEHSPIIKTLGHPDPCVK